jgi:hypothetical protein
MAEFLKREKGINAENMIKQGKRNKTPKKGNNYILKRPFACSKDLIITS